MGRPKKEEQKTELPKISLDRSFGYPRPAPKPSSTKKNRKGVVEEEG